MAAAAATTEALMAPALRRKHRKTEMEGTEVQVAWRAEVVMEVLLMMRPTRARPNRNDHLGLDRSGRAERISGRQHGRQRRPCSRRRRGRNERKGARIIFDNYCSSIPLQPRTCSSKRHVAHQTCISIAGDTKHQTPCWTDSYTSINTEPKRVPRPNHMFWKSSRQLSALTLGFAFGVYS